MSISGLPIDMFLEPVDLIDIWCKRVDFFQLYRQICDASRISAGFSGIMSKILVNNKLHWRLMSHRPTRESAPGRFGIIERETDQRAHADDQGVLLRIEQR